MSDTQEIIARIPLEGDAIDEREVLVEGDQASIKLDHADPAYATWFDDIVAIPECLPSVATLEEAVSEATGRTASFDEDSSVFQWTETGEIELSFTLATSDPEPEPGPDYLVLRRAIIDAERACQRAETDYEQAKEEASFKKKILEHAVDKLRRIAREISEPLPLFEHAKKQEALIEDIEDPDAWRAVPLSDALPELSVGTIEKLTEAGLGTIGDLADYSNAGKLLIDVPGIGNATAEKIEEAQANYWARG